MEYFKLLHLEKEPFSNSPDPAFFYASRQHKDCMQKLEIAVRLKRGLNVVAGEVGTGKTTLCRQMIRAFSDDPRISACLVLDPDFQDPRSFLETVVHMMTGCKPAETESLQTIKEKLKHHLFQNGVEEDRTVVLIVDEGQKMPPACLETLRELLNFETNEHKLLQIIIFAQNEFAGVLDALPNLADRINLYYRLKPLPFSDVRALIRHRLQNAATPESTLPRLFSTPALWRIYRASGGYPRKIIHLCHQCLLTMIIQNKTAAGWRMAGACARRTFSTSRGFNPFPAAVVLLAVAIIGFASWYGLRKPAVLSTTVRKQAEKTAAPATPPKQTAGEAITPQAEADASDGDISSVESIAASTEDQATAPPPIPKTLKTEANLPPTAPEDAMRVEAFSGEAPPMLGHLRVAVGDTLGGLLQKVYGAYTYRYHQAVMAANPQLTDPNSLRAGQSLIFPDIVADPGKTPDTTWWVSFSRKPDLQSAIEKLREEEADDLPLRLLAIRNPEEGLFFRIVLETCFAKEHAAETAKEQLALSETTVAEIVCLKNNESTLYGSSGT